MKPQIVTDEIVTVIETETTTQLVVVEEMTAEIQIDHETIAIVIADVTTANETMRGTVTGKEKETENPEMHIANPKVHGTEITIAEITTKPDLRNHVLLPHTATASDVHQEEHMDTETEVATDFQEAEMDMEDVGVTEGTRSISYSDIKIRISMDTRTMIGIETKAATREMLRI